MIKTRPRGFTLVEMVIGLAIFLLISIFYFRTVLFSSKMEQATSKKILAVQALQVLQARIRRDVKWARKVKSESGGNRLVLEDFGGPRKVYSYDPQTKLLEVPSMRGGTEPYRQCKFRVVKFYFTEHRSEGVRTIISPLPPDEHEGGGAPRRPGQGPGLGSRDGGACRGEPPIGRAPVRVLQRARLRIAAARRSDSRVGSTHGNLPGCPTSAAAARLARGGPRLHPGAGDPADPA
jgi:prepilin-type N-terminal cleavage/methylation domain-containing protein